MQYVVLVRGKFSNETFCNAYVVEAPNRTEAIREVISDASLQEKMGSDACEVYPVLYTIPHE